MLAIALVGVILFLVLRRSAPQPVAVAQATQPSTIPTSAPTTSVSKPRSRTYMDVVLAAYPRFPTTQPLGIPLDLTEAARLMLPDPLYLDTIGQLWITREDADQTPSVLKRANKEQTHVLGERVVFVHRSPDDRGVWQPSIIVARDGGGFELISIAGRQDLRSNHEYEWDRAFSWISNTVNAIVVPTRGGISIFRPDRRPMELHHQFIAPDAAEISQTQMLLDWRGLLAWMPWEAGKTGSDGAARFVDDQWITLDSKSGWPRKLLHLVPLLDGGVIQLVVNDEDSIEVALAILDPAKIDENRVVALVDQLSDTDPEKRKTAYRDLARYGQGIWPLLEKLAPDQPPEAKLRIERLLMAKLEPMLGGMKLMPGPVKVISRSRGGAAMLYAEQGAVVPVPDDFDLIAPAWLVLQPGRPITLAADDMVADLVPGMSRLDIVAGEFIVSDDVQGPRWWLANHFSEPLLKKSELEFKHIVGQDARGRWLFRKSPDDISPTLIVDPTLPDPNPRLPVWRFPVPNGIVGWTPDGWPAIKSGGAWVLTESDWRPLDEKKEKFITELPDEPTTNESSQPILTHTDGSRDFDGRETLRVIKPDGTTITWRLPPEAVGSGIVWLVRAGEDRLFLFNEPGRILRIKPTPEGPEPFKIEATFTRKIPNSDNFSRLWVDPAGRIVIAHDIDTLSIMFPTGIVPPEIAKKIPASELRDEE